MTDPGAAASLVAEYPVPLVHSKLALEPPRPFLPRRRLAEMLGGGPRPRLVLVRAPAGSGKSTLLYQLLSSHPSAVVYYRLSQSDRDVPQFVSYIVAGISRHVAGFGQKVEACLNEIHERPVLARSVRDIFIHEIGQLGRWPLWIVLDDYQDADDSLEIANLVKDLVEAIPPGVRLIIASRSIPVLPVNRWRAHGDLLEIGPTHLAFTWEECVEFFHRVARVSLGDGQLKAIYTTTEGWPAGLALAAQIARARPAEEAVQLVQGFMATGSPIYDYLAEQVYATQPPSLREFLRRSSILSYLSTDLCNELLTIENAGRILEELYRAGLFILPLEKGKHTFRYHQLFREFLCTKLEEEETEETVRRLRRVAGRALEARREWDEAIRQYARGGDAENASRLVARFGEQAIEAGQLERVSRWLRDLPEEVVEGQPRLLALRGLMALRLGDTPTAFRIFERCGWKERSEDDRRVSLAVAKHVSLAHYREGSYTKAAQLLREAIDRDKPDVATRIGLERLLGVAYRGAGELDQAERLGREVLRSLEAYPRAIARPAVTRVATIRNLTRVALCRGDLNSAVHLAREAVRISEMENAGEFQQVRALTILGAVLSARGDFEESIQMMGKAREKGADFYPPERQWIAGWLGNVYRDMGDLALAEGYYEQAGHRFSDEFAFLLLRRGQLRRALALAQDAMASRASLESPPEKASAQVAYALGLAMSGLQKPAVQALESAAEVLQKYGFNQRYASACLRLAELWRTADQGRSRLWLQRWLETSKRWGLHHFQWWDPELFGWAVAEAVRAGIETDHATALAVRRLGANKLIALRWNGNGQPMVDPQGSLGSVPDVPSASAAVVGQELEHLLDSCRDPQVEAAVRELVGRGMLTCSLLAKLRDSFHLTWKEVLVFLSYHLRPGSDARLCDGGLRSRVAAELCISENTLKFHVANIRRKLDLPHRIGTVGLLTWAARHGILLPIKVSPTRENSTAGWCTSQEPADRLSLEGERSVRHFHR